MECLSALPLTEERRSPVRANVVLQAGVVTFRLWSARRPVISSNRFRTFCDQLCAESQSWTKDLCDAHKHTRTSRGSRQASTRNNRLLPTPLAPLINRTSPDCTEKFSPVRMTRSSTTRFKLRTCRTLDMYTKSYQTSRFRAELAASVTCREPSQFRSVSVSYVQHGTIRAGIGLGTSPQQVNKFLHFCSSAPSRSRISS